MMLALPLWKETDKKGKPFLEVPVKKYRVEAGGGCLFSLTYDQGPERGEEMSSSWRDQPV